MRRRGPRQLPAPSGAPEKSPIRRGMANQAQTPFPERPPRILNLSRNRCWALLCVPRFLKPGCVRRRTKGQIALVPLAAGGLLADAGRRLVEFDLVEDS